MSTHFSNFQSQSTPRKLISLVHGQNYLIALASSFFEKWHYVLTSLYLQDVLSEQVRSPVGNFLANIPTIITKTHWQWLCLWNGNGLLLLKMHFNDKNSSKCFFTKRKSCHNAGFNNKYCILTGILSFAKFFSFFCCYKIPFKIPFKICESLRTNLFTLPLYYVLVA